MKRHILYSAFKNFCSRSSATYAVLIILCAVYTVSHRTWNEILSCFIHLIECMLNLFYALAVTYVTLKPVLSFSIIVSYCFFIMRKSFYSKCLFTSLTDSTARTRLEVKTCALARGSLVRITLCKAYVINYVICVACIRERNAIIIIIIYLVGCGVNYLPSILTIKILNCYAMIKICRAGMICSGMRSAAIK